MLNECMIAKYKDALEKDGFLYLGNKSLKDYYGLTLEEVIELNERVGIPSFWFPIIPVNKKYEQLNVIGRGDKSWGDVIKWLKKKRFSLPLNDFEAVNDYLHYYYARNVHVVL